MALPGHSPPPPPFGGPGSPPRSLNGYAETHLQFPPYGPQSRPMPPPSPHTFPPRYSQGPPPVPSASTALNYPSDARAALPPQKRPGSSMSISSMLGSEPEKPQHSQQDPFYNLNTRAPQRPHSTTGPSMNLGAVMSPPQYPTRPAAPDYSYKPRSRTPDRISDNPLTRPNRSSSGSLIQRPGPFYDYANGVESRSHSRFGGPVSAASHAFSPRKDEAAERARRTSISGILQRPESEPVRPASNTHFNPSPVATLQPEYPAPVPAPLPAGNFGAPKAVSTAERPAGPVGSYDTRPPALSNSIRPSAAPTTEIRGESQSRSPEIRRAHPNGTDPRNLAGLLNPRPDSHAPRDQYVGVSQNMNRQESATSQSDRSVGDRYKPRAFSPFASSVASHTMSSASVPAEDQGRKGSDELSQHRALLAIAADSKRGRYSPVPQVVQGAQAQTPVPDAGIKSEHGRVFAGLGGGLASSSTGPTSTPVGLATSPFKQNDVAARLSEENLMKMSRSTSGINKRPRKYDEDIRAESDVGDGKKFGPRKKSKYSHSYRVDLEEGINRRSTPLSAPNGFRRAETPTNVTSHHHHQLQRQAAVSEPVSHFKPKKTIRMSSVIAAAKRQPRRHLGNFTYNPEIANSEGPRLGFEKFDVSIKPNLLPSFAEAEHVNCTYSVRVPKIWLQDRERGLICKEAYLWGSGIYTDDSDVVAAAMHAGYIQSRAPDNVDGVLLDRVVKEQNARVEGLIDLPDTPMEVEKGTDMVVTLVVLPGLDRYVGSSRFGVGSRSWGAGGGEAGRGRGKVQHDGVSFAIVKVEFVKGGVEGRRMGRRGVEKRKRRERELMERRQSQLVLKGMLEKARRKLKEQGKLTAREKKPHPLSVAQNAADMVDLSAAAVRKDATTVTKGAVPALDVGHAPGEWLRQLEVSAIE